MRQVVAILKMPDVATKSSAMGLNPRLSTPQELHRAMQTEYTTYAKVIKDANITLAD